jgi:hypothetical protein
MVKYVLLLLLISLACKAQKVEPIFQNTNYGNRNNVYYKDLDNDFSPYVGTWKYTSGNVTFTIVLQKKLMIPKTIGQYSIYRDYLVGEYHYQINNNTIINTLPSLSNNYTKMLDYNLSFSAIVGNTRHPQCNNCPANQRRISMHFDEPTRRNVDGLSAGLMLRRITENGVAKIVAIFYNRSASHGLLSDGTPTDIEDYSIPYGTYVFTKVD